MAGEMPKVRTHRAMECGNNGVMEKQDFGGMGNQEYPSEMVLTRLHLGEVREGRERT